MINFKIISFVENPSDKWIVKSEMDLFLKDKLPIFDLLKKDNKLIQNIKTKSSTLVAALLMTVESQSSKIEDFTNRLVKINESRNISELSEYISEMYQSSSFDHNVLYLSKEYIPYIDQYSAWVHVVHLKLASLYLCLESLMEQDSYDSRKILLLDIEKLMNDLLIENVPFAPCINNFISHPITFLLQILPESTSHLIKLKISSFMNNRNKTPIQDIEKDKTHYYRKLLEVLYEHKDYFRFSNLNEEDYQLWEKAHLFSVDPEQMDYDFDDGPLFFQKRINELVELLQKLLLLISS